MDILGLLAAKGIDYIPKGDEIAIVCPRQHLHSGGADNKPSFGINLEKQVGHCFACGFSLNEAGMYQWLVGGELDELQLKALEITGALKRMQKAEVGALIEEAPDFFFPSGEPWAIDGFRGISLETYLELGAVKVERGRYGNRLCFPIYVDGELVGVDARALGDEQPKYLRNKGSSCRHNWMHPFDKVKAMKPKMVLLGEGLFHSTNAFDKGYAALCYFGANNFSANKIMMLLSTGATEICYFPDCDRSGYQAAQKICAALMPWFTVTYADISGYYDTGEDLGDLSAERIQAAIDRRGTPQLPFCLLEDWGWKIKYDEKCLRWKCPFNRRSACRNPFYEPEIKRAEACGDAKI